MATKIKLKRLGRMRVPQYRVVVADARAKRDGRPIEEIGRYHPKEHPSLIEIDSERARYWLGVGAQPTGPVEVLLKRTGDWQAHHGLPAPEQPLLRPEGKPDTRAAYEAASAEAAGLPGSSSSRASKASGGAGGTSADGAAQAPEQQAVATGAGGSAAPGDATA